MVFRFYWKVLSKSQNAGNAISETLNSKLFWRRIPPEPSTYDITLWGPKFFSRTVPCPKRYSVNGAYKRHFILQRSENTRKDTYAENVVVNYLRNSVKASLCLLYVVVSWCVQNSENSYWNKIRKLSTQHSPIIAAKLERKIKFELPHNQAMWYPAPNVCFWAALSPARAIHVRHHAETWLTTLVVMETRVQRNTSILLHFLSSTRVSSLKYEDA